MTSAVLELVRRQVGSVLPQQRLVFWFAICLMI
jgi:hypothetical protein